jgi:hypothetical protein
MRGLLVALFIVLLVVLLPCEAFAEPLLFGPEQEALLDVQDDYDTTNQVDMPATSAEVDTQGTKVMLPLNPCAVSIRAGTGHVAVKDADCIKIYAPGTHFVEQLTLGCPGVVSVSYSKDGRFLYASTANSVLKYAVSASDYVLVTRVDAADLVSVEGGEGHDIWVLRKTALERWLGTSDGGYSPVTVSTLTKGKSVSYSPSKNSAVVLDDSELRYFAVAANTIEIDKYRTSLPGATAVVQTESAIRVLVGEGSRYFSVQPEGLVEIPSLKDTQRAFALAAPNEKSQDFIAVTRGTGTSGDVKYKAHSGVGYTDNPARYVANATNEIGYKREAELLSNAFGATIPVNKVLATLNKTVPRNTNVRLDISTDGGATWITDITLDEVCEVDEGSELVYRLVLETQDPMETPMVDSIELLQILVKALGPGAGGNGLGGSQVRLVP